MDAGDREDVFTPIHKGLRSLLYDVSARIQTNDFADVNATGVLVHDLERDFSVARSAGCAVCIMSAHAGHEDRMVFPDAARVANDLVARLILDHHELTRREVAIAEAGRALLALGTPRERIAAGVRINQAANELISLYLDHMNREETELEPLMQQNFTDAQLAAMRVKVIASLPPEQLFAFLGWILPALNVTELAKLLGAARPGMPPPVFARVTELCAAKVDPARWAEVKSRLEI
jgi:Hemerythrin HHE cation binding domain